jgi:hypothetical protein
MSPNAGGGRVGVVGSQPMSIWSSNKLWRSNSIFNLCPTQWNLRGGQLSSVLYSIDILVRLYSCITEIKLAYLFPCLYTTDTYLTVQEMKNCTGTQSNIMDVLGFEQDRGVYRN